MSLPAKYRLPLRFERDRLTREGQTRYTRFFTIISAPSNSGQTEPRFAILLSKKTAKLAVDRNKIKRLTSAALLDLISLFPPADNLLIPKSQTLSATVMELKTDLMTYLNR